MSIDSDNVQSKRIVWALVAFIAALFLGGCSADAGSENVQSVEGALCAGVTVGLSPTSPQPAGTQVTISVSGTTCGAGESPEYVYFYYNAAGTFFRLKDWSSSPSANWDTTGLSGGSYGVYVAVRPAGSSAPTADRYVGGYFIGNVCSTTNTFSFSPTSPQPAGTVVSLSATATCSGGATPEFRYGYFTPAGSLVYINAGYSSAPVPWDTTGRAGNTTLLVYTRAVGNSSVEESYKYGSYTVGAAASLCSSAGISASPPSPRVAGALVTLSGTASPCATPEYQFLYRVFGNNPWLLLRDWGASTVNWDTTGLASGTYELLVWARSVGTTGTGDSYNEITYNIGSTCGSVTLGTSPASPQGTGAPVTLTGAATCTSGTPEYSFYYAPSSGGSLVLIRTWGGAQATWDTSAVAANTYTLTVYARAQGNTATFESLAVGSYILLGKQLTTVATGFGYHTCAVVNNGTASCWGEDSHGELGNGTTSASSSLPVAVSGLNTVSAVAVGGSHSCAVLTDHSVRCWGDGALGQLGNGGTSASSTPVTVTGISDATAISAGLNHTCVLRTGGAVSCWGQNSNGQVGSTVATDFPRATAPVAVAGISGATAVSAGGFHSCALVGGAVSCWGDNSVGQLGNGAGAPNNFSFAPVAVTGLSGVTAISGGEQHSCAVAAGAVRCWGDNTYGQLGDGTKTQANTPVSVSGISTAVQVGAGFPMSCARLSSGAVSCWGYNNEGELGNGSSSESLSPVAVSGISTATSLSTGGLQSCVLLSGGNAECWGYNGLGQLGNGTAADAHSPVSVTYP